MDPRHRIGAVVVLAIGTLVALTVWSWSGSGHLWLDIAVGIAGCALLPWVLRRPLSGALGLAALAVLSPAATPPATMAALHVAQRRRFPVAVGAAVAGFAAHAVQGLWRPGGGLSYGWWLALDVLTYTALVGWGALARTRRALIVSLRERARRAEAEQGRRVAEARVAERAAIAREMHDVLAHRLSLLATYAGALEYRPDSSPEQLAKAAGVVRTGVHQALDELRQVISVLREDDGDGDESPQPVWSDLPRLLEESRAAGADVRWDDQVRAAPPPGTGRAAYRVVQEGLTNARKHAAGRPVEVALAGRPGDRLTIEIRNGLAAGPPSVPGTGTGLIGLTERVALAGGQLDHERDGGADRGADHGGAGDGGEFRLRAWLPWPE